MSGSTLAAILSGWGTFGSYAWILMVLRSVRHRHAVVPLGLQSDREPPGGWPTLAVIFAARDEQSAIERATRSMLALDYPGLTVTAVDDRSTDGTGAILDRLAADSTRLTVRHVQELPAGWLGKNHALHSAAVSVDARWLLFTDADIVFRPGTLRRAVAYAESADVDHLTLAPDVATESFGERVFLAMFCLAFLQARPPWRVIDPRYKAAIGVGAFNLVRADAFRAVGGFSHLALSVDDDMRLGQALKFAGYGCALATAKGDVTVRWQVGLGGMIRGLEKNFFAGVGFRLWAVALGVLAILTVGVMPWVGLFMGPAWKRCVCGVGVASAALLVTGARGLNGLSWRHGLCLPLGALPFAYALVRSTWVTFRAGGVRWRGRLYPLGELRRHVRRRDAWFAELWRSTR